MTTTDLKNVTKKSGWNFDWKLEFKDLQKEVYKLTIVNNSSILQGLLSITIEQYEYLYKLTPTQELKDALQEVKEQTSVLNSKLFNLNTPKEKIPFNLSAYYWKPDSADMSLAR